jgi:hypothetical protein
MNFTLRSFTDELCKIAGAKGEGEYNFDVPIGTASAIMPSRMLGGLGAGALSSRIVDYPQDAVTPELAEGLRRRIAPRYSSPIDLSLESGKQSLFLPSNPRWARLLEKHPQLSTLLPPHVTVEDVRNGKILASPHGQEFLAHELGHASMGRVRAAIGKLRIPLAGAGLLGGLAALGSDDNRVSKVAPWITAAGYAPTLGEEALASIKGYRGMKSLGASPEVLRAARSNLTKAFGTYGAIAAGTTLPIAVAAYLRGKDRGTRTKVVQAD